MRVFEVDPITDPRWAELIARHPAGSVFHTTQWLEALRRTYGYQPVVFTTSRPGDDLDNGWAFCRVESWLTGRRMVSLPFSDHCQPLVSRAEDFSALASSLKEQAAREKWKSFEVRPLPLFDFNTGGLLFHGEDYCFHKLDLRPDLDTLLRSAHKSCVQRKIQRAEREQLAYEEGRSEAILAKFYRLLLLTRRRHQLPPQPLAWFRNLIGCLGDKLTLRIASKDGQPIAAILTLFYKNTLVYKYGCSDPKFHNLGGMPWLWWKAIQEGKQQGAQEFDLGRSDTDNAGLIAFKDHWGAQRSSLTYYRYPQCAPKRSTTGWRARIIGNVIGRMPDFALKAAGNLLYKHVG
ncbi:MAG TPA: GNAT family N-acetyltransferase [Terriglobia bacterium]|nr:GNAT family N-acetyltransferase [Terriglobia bacterium]